MAAILGGKSGYHHGDLRNALIAAAVALATDGGPQRVVLREAARRVGVSPTAAYRHFAGQGELLRTVKAHSRQVLADSMEKAAVEAPGADDPGLAAELRLAAIGRGYVGFALAQPGLYRAAFCTPRPPAGDERAWSGPEREGAGEEPRALRLFSEALDALVASGRMAAATRPGAQAAVWSALHGLSLLLIDGPLDHLAHGERGTVLDRTLAMVVSGVRTV